MEERNIQRLTKALGLRRKIVGIKLIAYEKEFEQNVAEQWKGKLSFCAMVNKGSEGIMLKANKDNFGCTGGGRALGIMKTTEAAKSGRYYKASGLYASYSIARNVTEHMQYLPYKNYGVQVGPLCEMEDADSVIIIANARQVMRIMQGYAYQYGAPEHLNAFGNQAMCADLVAKPLMNNDINISFMCRGARFFAKCDDGEMGIGIPIHMLDSLTKGIVKTMNVVETNEMKEEIKSRLSIPDELGTSVIMDLNYPTNLAKYQRYCEDMEEYEQREKGTS